MPLLWGMKQIITTLFLIVSMVAYGQDAIYTPKEVKCKKYVQIQTNSGEMMNASFEYTSTVDEIYISSDNQTVQFNIDREYISTDVIVVNNSTDVTQYVLRFEDKQFTMDVLDNRYFRLLAFINGEELLYTGLLD